MKKLFILSSVALLAASCTNEIIEEGPVSKDELKGISFKMVENDETRGMVTNDYKSFFYAELDRVDVYGDNVMDNAVTPAEIEFKDPLTKVTYKATKSKGNPYLTGINDANTINYKKAYAQDEYSNFFVVYPAGTTVKYTAADGGKFTVNALDITAQELSADGTMNFDKRLMYDFVANKRPEKAYNSVGETLALNLISPYTMLWYAFTDVESYNAFGKLQTITLKATSAEYVKNGEKKTTTSSPLASTGGTFTIKKDKTVSTSSLTNASTIILDVNQAVKNNQKLNMFALTKTGKIKDGGDYTLTDKYTITYTFENVDLIYDKKTSSGEWKAGAAYAMPNANGMTIADEYSYILTRGTSVGSNDRVLYVNKGTVAGIQKDGSIKWTDSNNAIEGKVEFTEVAEIIVNSTADALTDEDWKTIAKMTNLKKMTILNATTTVPAETIKGLNLTDVNLKNVTTISATSFEGSNLVNVIMPKYNFATNKTITQATLKPAYLETLDMSGTPYMKDVHPYEGMSLAGYTNLTEVTVQNGVVLGPESFKGCAALNKVTGYVVLGGYGAFEGCSSLEAISIDEVATTKIFAYTFNEATSLKDVFNKDGKTPIKPTVIEDCAFRKTKVNVDLTAATSIGTSAFAYNEYLKGKEITTGSGKYHLVVNAATVGVNAFFNATGLQYVQFNNLEVVNAGILSGTTLQELKFSKVFSFSDDAKNTVFGTTTGTKLFVNPSQKYNGNTINVNGGTITFETIIEEQ